MAGAKEIRGKIASIKNTQKITKAMEMVAASKMRKAQERMRAARPYAEKIRKIIGHLRQVNLDYKHPFTLERPVQAVGIIVISTDRGLCGALNLNLFKAALPRSAKRRPRTPRSTSVPIGSRRCSSSGAWPARDRRHGRRTWRPAAHQGSDRHRQGHARLRTATQDRPLLLVHNVFVNTMTQKRHRVAAAAAADRSTRSELQEHWDYIYEPDAAEILDGLLMRYIESQVFQGAVENVAWRWRRAWSP